MNLAEAIEWFEAHKPPESNRAATEAREAALEALKGVGLVSFLFDAPCNYTVNGVEFNEMMSEGDDGEWCEDHCSSYCDVMDFSECWFRAFELWRNLKNRGGTTKKS